jgi:hypothetical protein
LEKVNRGVTLSEGKTAGNGGSSYKTVETLLNVVATVHFANETCIFVDRVFTARRHTPTSALESLTSAATTVNGLYRYQPNNCQMMVLRVSTIVFYIQSFINRITTHYFTLPTIIAAIQKLTARLPVSIQSNLHFVPRFVLLHTWTTV